MFVFLYMAISGTAVTVLYMVFNYITKTPIEWQVPIGFMAYLIIDSFIVVSANTIDKWIYGLKAWRGNEPKD